jgi:hypothetical protein
MGQMTNFEIFQLKNLKEGDCSGQKRHRWKVNINMDLNVDLTEK